MKAADVQNLEDIKLKMTRKQSKFYKGFKRKYQFYYKYSFFYIPERWLLHPWDFSVNLVGYSPWGHKRVRHS